MFETVDADQSGYICFKEWLAVVSNTEVKNISTPKKEPKQSEFFKKIDTVDITKNEQPT